MSIEDTTNEDTPDISLTNLTGKKRGRGRPRKCVSTVKDSNTNSSTEKTKNSVIDNCVNNSTNSNKKVKTVNFEDDEIILHMPICFADVNSDIDNDNDLIVVDENSKKEKTTENKQKNTSTNIFTIDDISDDSSSEEFDPYEGTNELVKRLKQQNDYIKKLETDIKEYKDIILNSSDFSRYKDNKVTKMEINLVSIIDGKTVVVENTDVACWWCTETFDNSPFFLPERESNGIVYVSGCYCSPNCAAAKNINIDDYKVWERMSLLNKIYGLPSYKKDNIHTNVTVPIVPAFPKETLKKYGGHLDIHEYRKDSIRNHEEYRYILPPMVSIVPYIEKNYKDNSIWNKFKSTEESNNLVLKRTKPLPNSKNTLVETMGLVIKKKK